MLPKFKGLKKIPAALMVLWVLFSAKPGQSQNLNDTLKTYFSDFTFFEEPVPQDRLQNDTIFSSIFFYDPLKQQHLNFPRTGHPGSASLNVFGEHKSGKMFTDGFNQYTPFILKPFRNFPSDKGERRFTNVSYHLASKKEQHIFIRHEQKIRPWMMAGLDFGALSSIGDYARQLNTNRCFDTWFAYQAPANTYRVYVSFTSNKVENQENGGIAADSVFEDASSLDTKTLPINLENASMRHKLRDYVVKQDLNLLRLFDKADSTERMQDFTEGSLVLSHSLWWSRKSILFKSENADSGYFQNSYFDTTVTFDSSFYNDLYNQAMLEYTSPTSAAGLSFSLGGGINQQAVEYFTSVTDTAFNSLMAVVTGGIRSRRLVVNAVYSNSVAGDFDDSYNGGISVDYLMNDQGSHIFLDVSAGKGPQSLHDRLYVSNHFIWTNRFASQERFEASGGIELPRYKLGIIARSVTARNMVFYKEDYLPQTYNDYVTFGELTISKIFRFGKFGMDDKLTLGFSGNENVVRLPAASIYTSFYYANKLFKNALGFKAGVDVTWQSAYKNYGYMPATGVFYLQDEKEIGNYPMASVFVNMRIKTAILFIRLDHLNAGIGSRTYYGAYHYPLPGRTVKFGVSWDLFD